MPSLVRWHRLCEADERRLREGGWQRLVDTELDQMNTPNPIWISDWNPEDPTFWETKGKWIARRNLIWSIVAEHI